MMRQGMIHFVYNLSVCNAHMAEISGGDRALGSGYALGGHRGEHDIVVVSVFCSADCLTEARADPEQDSMFFHKGFFHRRFIGLGDRRGESGYHEENEEQAAAARA